MRRTKFNQAVIIFVAAWCALAAISCVQNAGDNSKVATLYRNTPTPAQSPAAEAALETTFAEATAATPVATPHDDAAPEPVLSPSSQSEIAAAPTNSPAQSADLPAAPPTNDRRDVNSQSKSLPVSETLMIPVVGVEAKSLQDTFNNARSGGRVHDSIDIMAPGGAPVVAAANGKIIKFHDSARGGITIYQLGADEKTVYYYAHLQKRADGLREGDSVEQGKLLGYVGDTGNSGAGNFHLHFQIFTLTDPKRFWTGDNINPYPLLKSGKPGKNIEH